MNMLTLELFKMKRRKLLWIPSLIFLLGLVWSLAGILQEFNHTSGEMVQTIENTLYSFSVLNAMFKPLLIVSLVTNLCENEHRHQTFKLLFTNQQNRIQLFLSKWFLTSGLLLVFGWIQILSISLLFIGYDVDFSVMALLHFGFLTFISSLLLATIHLFLSLYYHKQLISFGFALFGSFIGLATQGMLPRPLMIILPWQYYRLLAPYDMVFVNQEVLFIENQYLLPLALLVMVMLVLALLISLILYHQKEV